MILVLDLKHQKRKKLKISWNIRNKHWKSKKQNHQQKNIVKPVLQNKYKRTKQICITHQNTIAKSPKYEMTFFYKKIFAEICLYFVFALQYLSSVMTFVMILMVILDFFLQMNHSKITKTKQKTQKTQKSQRSCQSKPISQLNSVVAMFVMFIWIIRQNFHSFIINIYHFFFCLSHLQQIDLKINAEWLFESWFQKCTQHYNSNQVSRALVENYHKNETNYKMFLNLDNINTLILLILLIYCVLLVIFFKVKSTSSSIIR